MEQDGVKPEPEAAAADLVVGGNVGAVSAGTRPRIVALGRSLAGQPGVRLYPAGGLVDIWLNNGCLFNGNLGDDSGALKRGRKTVVTEQGTDSKIVIESVLDLDKACLAPVHSGSSHVLYM
jgi:hypothetical protein